MNTLTEAAARLREQADQLEALSSELGQPPGEPTLATAAVYLRALLGKSAYFTIDFSMNCHSSSKPEFEWKVYDGKKSHEAKTLVGALKKTAAANAPLIEQPTTVEDNQELVDPGAVPYTQKELEDITARK